MAETTSAAVAATPSDSGGGVEDNENNNYDYGIADADILDQSHTPIEEGGGIGRGSLSLTANIQLIDLTHTKVARIEGLEAVPQLRVLILRQNEISVIENVAHLSLLRHFDVYMNSIETLAGVVGANHPCLKWLDVSYNHVRAIAPPLSGFPELTDLYLCNNKIAAIEGLSDMPKLRTLELGSNRIRAIENLTALPSITSLFLGKNKIARIENIAHLRQLRVLSLQSNRIEKLEGLETLTALQELYVSFNGIKRIEGLSALKQLTTLDVSKNFIESLDGLQECSALTELWCSENKVADFAEVQRLLANTRLETLYLEHNPVYGDAQYRRRCMDILPTLTQIDAVPVVRN